MSASQGFRHECPVSGCAQMVPDTMLMCARHWRRVPRAIALRVYAEYRKAPGSDGHRAICRQAVEAVEAAS